MEKEFIPYKQALALKELGFDEPCLAFSYVKSEFGYIAHKVYLIDYLDDDSIVKNSQEEYYYTRPTFSQAFRWFREKYDFKSWIQEYENNTFIYEIRPHVLSHYKEGEIYVYSAHEEAELACLKKLIEIVENGKH
jgi:hypothetical protein